MKVVFDEERYMLPEHTQALQKKNNHLPCTLGTSTALSIQNLRHLHNIDDVSLSISRQMN